MTTLPTTWIFDLDNTLYPPSCGIYAAISQRVKQYLCDRLQITFEDAVALQRRYHSQYGNTTSGLKIEHGVAPEEFLGCILDIDLAALSPTPALEKVLKLLPGRKFVFTNSLRLHAERVLERLGIAHHFTDIFDIAASDYMPKPDPGAYQRFLDHCNVAPRTAIMFEDYPEHLKPASALGITTVLVNHPGPFSAPYVNEETSNLTGYLLNRLLWAN